MIFSKLDFFSSQFSFNTGNHQAKRGTLFGTLLSFIVFTTTIVYFVYIFTQYITNQIDPIFRSQSLISQGLIQTGLSSDLIGFRFEYGSSSYEELYPKNYTYLVFLAYLQYTTPDINILIPLNVINCTNPDLEGFKCLDFSNVKNYTLFLDTDKNMKSTVQVQTYGCRDIDTLKTTVPDNCADQSLIDNMINGINSILRFKIQTSQYNTATQRKEVNYRNSYVYTVANQQIVTQLKTQIQNTSIKSGLIVQSQTNFTSPIQCNQQDQSIDRNYALVNIGAGSYNMMILLVDEIVQHIQIQYPTLPQVLALVSSIFTLLMMIGFFGRMVSQKSIQQDLLKLFLKNIYQDNYLGMLKKANNNIKQQQNQQSTQINKNNLVGGEQKQTKQRQVDKQQEIEQQVYVPTFQNKQKKLLDLEQLTILMLLKKDQLAALHLVGCSSSYFDIDLNNIKSDTDGQGQKQNLSYYEQQLTILQSEQLQNQYIQDFLSKFSDNQNVNEIDIRIQSSIQKCHLN
ncbi:transmembrane protein, putative (macronuclear) [Tetrahymena thermophila SB210]|uniref:Transmembrane protein, putative n=1 Tax=Tetrahymena thermophila (strain SB210) TaxID=312017 RepID=Q241W7_TETTS|nr:transmembrane protein, putative [Tetrahymena thermophila SB210]EAS02584.2 transmembrane protein, putative [Tetrahymena thermophila SB210]|eukprot:XP_001022829.2 transmembrane protein, putative [Tetrahymena thermophila SB210]